MNIKLHKVVQARDALRDARDVLCDVAAGRDVDIKRLAVSIQEVRDAWAMLDVWLELDAAAVEVTQ